MQTKKNPRGPVADTYVRRGCPGGRAATDIERLYWETAEDVASDLAAARADSGHTAVSTLQKQILDCRLQYHAARAARLADAARVTSGGDAVTRLRGIFGAQLPSVQDAIMVQFSAVVDGRRGKGAPLN